MAAVGSCFRYSISPLATSASNGNGNSPVDRSKVLILGGTGRIGGSTAAALTKLCPSLEILIAGRDREKADALAHKLGKKFRFVRVNIDRVKMLEDAMKGVDLVVHAAGPFQQKEKCNVLEAAISTKTAYMDVCDDADYAWQAKYLHKKAVDAGVPAITTAGIYPGVSNVMAAELVRYAKIENAGEPESLRFNYYTAGSGGAGPAILASSFLLLGQDAIAYDKGEKIKLKPYSGMLNIDFGRGIGKKDVYYLNFPEVMSAYKCLGVSTVSARFGTSPVFWNWGMEAFARFIPADILRDESQVQQLVELLDPLVRALDGIAGERVAMRVDLDCSGGRNTLGLFSHRRLSISAGYAAASFALVILEGCTQPGVWFPEEPEGIPVEARKVLLERAAQGTINFVMNKNSTR